MLPCNNRADYKLLFNATLDFKINTSNVEINIETSSNIREKDEFFMVVGEGYKNMQDLLIWRSIIDHGP